MDARLDNSIPTWESLSQSLFPSQVIKEASFNLSRMYKQCLLLCPSQLNLLSSAKNSAIGRSKKTYTSTGCFFRFPWPLRVSLSKCEMKTVQHPPFAVRKLPRKSLFSFYARSYRWPFSHSNRIPLKPNPPSSSNDTGECNSSLKADHQLSLSSDSGENAFLWRPESSAWTSATFLH